MLTAIGELFLDGNLVDFGKANYVEHQDPSLINRGKAQGQVFTDHPPSPWNYDKMIGNK